MCGCDFLWITGLCASVMYTEKGKGLQVGYRSYAGEKERMDAEDGNDCK